MSRTRKTRQRGSVAERRARERQRREEGPPPPARPSWLRRLPCEECGEMLEAAPGEFWVHEASGEHVLYELHPQIVERHLNKVKDHA